MSWRSVRDRSGALQEHTILEPCSIRIGRPKTMKALLNVCVCSHVFQPLKSETTHLVLKNVGGERGSEGKKKKTLITCRSKGEKKKRERVVSVCGFSNN